MKKIMVVLFTLILLSACSTRASEIVIVTAIVEQESAETPSPAVVIVTEKTPTAAAISPSPTPSGPQLPASFMDAAGQACENAFLPDTDQPWGLILPGPAIALEKVDYDDDVWKASEFMPIPEDIETAINLICIQQSRINKGTYMPIGGTAYQHQWDLWLLNWPEGELLGSRTFMGGPPPKTKTGAGSRYGESPADEALAWVETAISQPLASLNVSLYSLSYIPESENLLTHTRGSYYVLDTDGQQQSSFDVSDPGASRMAFSPDGRLAAVVICTQIEEKTCTASELEVRSVETGERIFSLQGDPEYNWILSLAFSPNSRTLLSGHSGNIERTTREQLWRWDMQTGRGTVLIEGEVGHVYELRIAPDGKTFAANLNAGVRLNDLQTGEQVSVTERKGQWPSFEFSPDGSTLAVAYCEEMYGQQCALGGIMLWDLAGEAEITSWSWGESSIQSMAFSPDGSTLAAAVCSQTRLWISEQGEPRHICTAFEINLWDTTSGAIWQTFDGHLAVVSGLAFSPDGSQLFSASHDGTIRVWQIE